MKTGYLRFKECKDNEITNNNFENVGNNTGNLVFEHAIINTIKCTPFVLSELREKIWQFDNIVVRDFIWIQENVEMDYFKNVLDLCKYKAIIPLSVGLQAKDYKKDFIISKSTVKILSEISEKALIAVRGAYTAEILNKYGINNIRIVGCPSMYLNVNYERKIERRNIDWSKAQTIGNYKTLAKELNTNTDTQLLNYFKDNTTFFLEQTKCYFTNELRQEVFKAFMEYYERKQRIFFNFEDWYKFVSSCDFCIGARFHGNVTSLLAGVPALFIVFDSRTKELTDYFKFPTIDIEDFDISKPLEYYYDMADYTYFNQTYEKRLDNFIDFCLTNNLELIGDK